MANVNAPNGFQFFGKMEGASPTVGLTPRKLVTTTAIGYGDPVVSLGTGYIDRATAGTTQIAGVFYGCKYFSPSIGRVVWSKSWPGGSGTATGDVLAYLDTDPQSLYVVQALANPIVFADINANINFAIGTPQTEAAGGFSTSSVDQSLIGVTATLPFRIIGLLSDYISAAGANGCDNTSNFNRVVVRANFWDRVSTTGIV